MCDYSNKRLDFGGDQDPIRIQELTGIFSSNCKNFVESVALAEV